MARHDLHTHSGSEQVGEDDRMLTIILADRALENAEPGEARFVVAYFRYRNSPLQNIDQIVREIIGSRSFSEYMTLNE